MYCNLNPLTWQKRIVSCVVVGVIALYFMAQPVLALGSSAYTYKKPSFDGIGKVYMGREIAEVMGHEGADWLERSSRILEEDPPLLIESLKLNPTDVVADIGAGTGYIAFQIASELPQGKVLAVDIQPEMIDILGDRMTEKGLTNVEAIQGTEQSPNLRLKSIDLAIMVDAYHEFTYPREMMTEIVKALKPNGRVALVEYRAKDPFVFIKPHHKMTQAQVRKEMDLVGLKVQEINSVLPQQHLMLFARKEALGTKNYP